MNVVIPKSGVGINVFVAPAVDNASIPADSDPTFFGQFYQLPLNFPLSSFLFPLSSFLFPLSSFLFFSLFLFLFLLLFLLPFFSNCSLLLHLIKFNKITLL
jgi:hypothetical protein